jgi:hypothetical protein
MAGGCCLATPTTGGLACGYHGSLGDGFSALHPQSINVAMATREAIDQGLLEQPNGLPRFVAFARAGHWLDRLKQALAPTLETQPAQRDIALLLIDGGLWTRYLFAEGKLIYEPHVAGPNFDDVVVLTSEVALRGLIEGRISVDRATHDGLLVVTANSDAASSVTVLKYLQKAFEHAARF